MKKQKQEGANEKQIKWQMDSNISIITTNVSGLNEQKIELIFFK